MSWPLLKITTYTAAALVAFAGNSVLCRMAMGGGAMDPTSFTVIRLVAGAVMLGLIVRFSPLSSSPDHTVTSRLLPSSGSWLAAVMLLIYAAAFSYAYVRLDAGVGALILFGVVQVSMVLYGVSTGERLGWVRWLGLCCAFGGLVYLLVPVEVMSFNVMPAEVMPIEQSALGEHASDGGSLSGQSAGVSISVGGFLLMSLSGLAWSMYTLLGKSSTNPLNETAGNFMRAAFLSLPLLLVLAFDAAVLSYSGILLAVASGALMSGLGYSLWYKAVPYLSVIQSGVVQLSVPVMAVLGGMLFIREPASWHLLAAMFITLFGILVTLCGSASVTPRVAAK